MHTPESEVTRVLDAWSAGEPEALDQLIPLVIDDLRRMAASFLGRGKPGHTLQPTALVNEVYLHLVGHRSVRWESRAQFFAFMATVMRHILVDHARRRKAIKRGEGATLLSFDEAFGGAAGKEGGLTRQGRAIDLLALDKALESLAAVDPRQCRIVELRYFGGLTVEEAARVLEISPRTVKREWRTARLWLLRELGTA